MDIFIFLETYLSSAAFKSRCPAIVYVLRMHFNVCSIHATLSRVIFTWFAREFGPHAWHVMLFTIHVALFTACSGRWQMASLSYSKTNGATKKPNKWRHFLVRLRSSRRAKSWVTPTHRETTKEGSVILQKCIHKEKKTAYTVQWQPLSYILFITACSKSFFFEIFSFLGNPTFTILLAFGISTFAKEKNPFRQSSEGFHWASLHTDKTNLQPGFTPERNGPKWKRNKETEKQNKGKLRIIGF